MAWWDGLLGGGGGSDPLDIYGDLFSKEQKAALQQRQSGEGLLRLAGAFGKAAQPSRMPTSFMGALGEAAGAMAGSGDEAANTAIKGMEAAEKVRQARAERAILAKAAPLVEAITARLIGAGVPAAQATQIATQVAGQQAAPAPAPDAPAPPGGPQPPEAPPPLNAYGMPQPRNNTAFGIPQRPGQPPLTPTEAAGTQSLSTAGMGQRGGLPPDQKYNSQGQPISPDLTAVLPGQQSGASYPAGMRFPAAPSPPAGQQNTGLLPSPDQVVGPDGQPLQGPGVLPNIMNASLAGGMPGGGLPFTRASSTPTGAAPRGADREKLLDTIARYESGGRNIPQGIVPPGGGYNPSVGRVTGSSTAQGPWQITNSTWRSAAPKAGVNVEKYPTAMSAPVEVQRQVAGALLDEQGLKPWAPYNKALAAATGYQGGGQDYVIPSGRGVPASMLRTVADTGGAPGGGFLPGTDVRPEELAALNAMLKMGGIKSDPFGSLLDTYYKSPGYLAEKARTEAQATKDVAYKMDPLIAAQTEAAKARVDFEWKPKIEEAVQKLQSPIIDERNKAKAEIDRYSEMIKQDKQASLTPVDTTVADERGQPTATKITALEFAKRQQDRANRIARGDTTVKPGDIIGTPVLSPEETEVQKQRGKTSQEMREVDVWTPTGTVKQTMTNQEIAARQALAAQRGAAGAPQIGDIVDKPSMTPTDQKLADALGEEFITVRKQALAADKTIRDTHNLRSKLDSGMFTGLDSNLNLFLARLGDTMGWKNLSDPEKVKNTETYIAGLGSEVLSLVSALRPASNVDLDFAKSMAGGQNLSAASIRQLLDMREEYARLAIQRHNEDAAGRNPAIFQGARREIPLPPAYQPKELVTPSGNKARINR